MIDLMQYRFVRVTSNYPQYLKGFYEKHPGVELMPYTEQYNMMTADSFESATAYTRSFRRMGIEAFDIISNAKPLQEAWKKAHKLPEEITEAELIIRQLKKLTPEVVWIDDFAIVDKEWKSMLLQEVPSIRLLVAHICAPYNSAVEEKLKLFDLVFTCIPCFKKDIEKLGVKTHLIYHCFEPEILKNIHINNNFPESDFLFSGSLYTGSGFHKSRIEYIENMLKAGIGMDLYCNLESRQKVILKKAMYLSITFLRKAGLENLIDSITLLRNNVAYGNVPVKYYSQKLLKSSKPPVFGYDMYRLLAKARICFNIHGEVAEKCAGNIRLFEATGVGSCLVTDWKDNIAELFDPEKEIVTYKSKEECIDKVKWLLKNPGEREKIARAGQKRTLSDHTVERRTAIVDKVFREILMG